MFLTLHSSAIGMVVNDLRSVGSSLADEVDLLLVSRDSHLQKDYPLHQLDYFLFNIAMAILDFLCSRAILISLLQA